MSNYIILLFQYQVIFSTYEETADSAGDGWERKKWRIQLAVSSLFRFAACENREVLLFFFFLAVGSADFDVDKKMSFCGRF